MSAACVRARLRARRLTSVSELAEDDDGVAGAVARRGELGPQLRARGEQAGQQCVDPSQQARARLPAAVAAHGLVVLVVQPAVLRSKALLPVEELELDLVVVRQRD